jgi:hypothetical protein
MPLEQVFLRVSFSAFLLIVIKPLLHAHLSPLPDMCDSPDQAAHYHISCLEVTGFITDRALR